MQRQENATAEVEQIQRPEAAPEQSDLEVEVEVSNENAQNLGRGPLLSFEPLNPDNSNITKEQNENEENGPAYIFPLTNNPRHQENRNQTNSLSPTECQLNDFDIPTEFPLISNSLEGRRTNRHIYDLHWELAPFGFVLKEGDIVSSSPLDNQVRSSSKIPIVIGYKDPQTRQDVVRAAREANLWNSRVPKKDDKKKDRRGFFHHHHITRRHIKNKQEEKQPKPTIRGQPKLRQKSKPYLPNNEQDLPDLRERLSKIKVDRVTKERKQREEIHSTSSSVEIIEEIRPISGEMVEEIRGAMDAQKPDTQEAASDADLEGILQERRAEMGIKIRNWLEGQENPKFEPKLHLRKVDQHVPDL